MFEILRSLAIRNRASHKSKGGTKFMSIFNIVTLRLIAYVDAVIGLALRDDVKVG